MFRQTSTDRQQKPHRRRSKSLKEFVTMQEMKLDLTGLEVEEIELFLEEGSRGLADFGASCGTNNCGTQNSGSCGPTPTPTPVETVSFTLSF
jgi:hypothetical protein